MVIIRKPTITERSAGMTMAQVLDHLNDKKTNHFHIQHMLLSEKLAAKCAESVKMLYSCSRALLRFHVNFLEVKRDTRVTDVFASSWRMLIPCTSLRPFRQSDLVTFSEYHLEILSFLTLGHIVI